MIAFPLLLLSSGALAFATPAPFRPDSRLKPDVVESRAAKISDSEGIVSIPLNKGPAHHHMGNNASTTVDLDWLISTRARTQRKYNAHRSKEEKRAAASEGLTDADESLWFGPITIGGESFNIDFDTGSADLWVPSASCTTDGCVGHNKYNLSATGSLQSGSFEIHYGDGSSTSGPIYRDDVSIAGLTATNQTFSAATEMAASFSTANGYPADGILGLAFPSLSALRSNPFFQTLVAQGKVSSPVFSFYLASTGSELYLGGINAAKYTGAIAYTPVVQATYWTVGLDGVKVDSTPVKSSASLAIVDTGTTLIYGPTDAVTSLYAAIPGSITMSSMYGSAYEGYWLIPCSSDSVVSFGFGGNYFSIPPSTFSLGQVAYRSQNCVGAVLADDSFGPDVYLVGDTFLSSVYSIYDVGKERVGFAEAR